LIGILASSDAFAATAAQRTTWQNALQGGSAQAALDAVTQIEAQAMDDAAVIPMLIKAITRKDKAGPAACTVLGKITQYPVFPDITCRQVYLPDAQKAWQSWHKPRTTWTFKRIRDDSADKRQRLLRSKRVDEALRGLRTAMAFGTDDAEVKKVVQRFNGELHVSLSVRDSGSRWVIVKNVSKTSSIFAIDDRHFCKAAEAAACPSSAAPLAPFEFATMLTPGQSKKYVFMGTGDSVSTKDLLRDISYGAYLPK
jgi:hypothetical protein